MSALLAGNVTTFMTVPEGDLIDKKAQLQGLPPLRAALFEGRERRTS